MRIAAIILGLFFSGSVSLHAAVYYVDAVRGADNNSGLSGRKAWRTVEKVNEYAFKAGDKIMFKSGCQWGVQLLISRSGSVGKPIVYTSYGRGNKPEINVAGRYKDAVLIRNASNIRVENLALSNYDNNRKYQLTGPTGLRVLSENYGTMYNIALRGLYIHDINGDNKKGSKEGHGIYWDCQGPAKSNIENLLIENCRLERVDRNGIRGNGTFGLRSNWFPNKNLVIRNCYMNDIGGDGIVVKAFDKALVEYCKIFKTRTRAADNAVAIWPHSSDNTTIQYNEVAYTVNNNWANDGQSFDIDGNCRNTIIQNNYSHDNDGGFMLVISDYINADNVVTEHNIIRNNLSINDGNKRKRLFNFAGKTMHTLVEGNVFINTEMEAVQVQLVNAEGGAAEDVKFTGNEFIYKGTNRGVLDNSAANYKGISFTNNIFKGNLKGTATLNDGKAAEKIRKGFPWNVANYLLITSK